MGALAHGLRWSLLALCCAIAFSSWFACSSTETGNPPVLDPQRLAFHVVADGIKVTGEAGAVLPGGSTVEFAGADQVAVISMQTAADGSFQTTIPLGTLDGLSIRAVGAGGGSEWQEVPTQPTSMCGELDANVERRMREALTSASTACNDAADCVLMQTRTSCRDSCEVAVATSTAAALSTDLAQLEVDLCAEHAARSCMPIIESCPIDDGSTALCIEGRCDVVHDGPTVISVERL